MKKNLIILFILTQTLISCSSYGLSGQQYSVNSNDLTRSESSEMVETRVVKTYMVPRSRMKIEGLCFIETSSSRDTCENITLYLIDNEKKTKIETVTDEIGGFVFNSPDRSPKNIEVFSKKYKLKAGRVAVQAGSTLTIILVKK